MFLSWNLSPPEHAWSQNSCRTFCDVSLADGKHLVMNVVWRHEGREKVKANQKDNCYPTTCLRRLNFGLSTASYIIPCETLQQADSLIHREHSLGPWIVTPVEVYPGLLCTFIARAPGLSPLLKSVLVHHAHSLYMLLDCRPCGSLSWFSVHAHCTVSGLSPLCKSILVHHAHSLYMLLDCLPYWSLSEEEEKEEFHEEEQEEGDEMMKRILKKKKKKKKKR